MSSLTEAIRAAPSEYAALDVVYDVLDDLLVAGRFEECDEHLSSVPFEEFPTSLAMSALTITSYFDSKLKNRTPLYEKLRARLILEKGKRHADVVLRGLEPRQG